MQARALESAQLQAGWLARPRWLVGTGTPVCAPAGSLIAALSGPLASHTRQKDRLQPDPAQDPGVRKPGHLQAGGVGQQPRVGPSEAGGRLPGRGHVVVVYFIKLFLSTHFDGHNLKLTWLRHHAGAGAGQGKLHPRLEDLRAWV